MEENTSLVLLPPLDLISVESLPKEQGQKLAVLKEELAVAKRDAQLSILCAVFAGFFGVTYSAATAVLLMAHAPLALAIIAGLLSTALVTTCSWFVHKSVHQVRACRQINISPQLAIEAEHEALLLDTAEQMNVQIASWNGAAESAAKNNVGRKYLNSLHRQRVVLSTHTDKLLKLAKRSTKPSK